LARQDLKTAGSYSFNFRGLYIFPHFGTEIALSESKKVEWMGGDHAKSILEDHDTIYD
jgi:hypothetical protein